MLYSQSSSLRVVAQAIEDVLVDAHETRTAPS